MQLICVSLCSARLCSAVGVSEISQPFSPLHPLTATSRLIVSDPSAIAEIKKLRSEWKLSVELQSKCGRDKSTYCQRFLITDFVALWFLADLVKPSEARSENDVIQLFENVF